MYIVLGNSLSVVFKLQVYCFGQLLISSVYVKPKNSLGQLLVSVLYNYYYGSYTGCLPLLSTLQIAHNKLKTAQDIEELAHCPSLRYFIIINTVPAVCYYNDVIITSLCSVVDVSHNRLEDVEVITVITRMPKLVRQNNYYHRDNCRGWGASGGQY